MNPRPLHRYQTHYRRTEVQPRSALMRFFGIPARVDEVEYEFTIYADRPVSLKIVEQRNGDLRPICEPEEQGAFTYMQNPNLSEFARTKINY